jgi:hypothetical protein
MSHVSLRDAKCKVVMIAERMGVVCSTLKLWASGSGQRAQVLGVEAGVELRPLRAGHALSQIGYV